MDDSRKRPPKNSRNTTRDGDLRASSQGGRRGSDPNNRGNGANDGAERKRSLSDYKADAAGEPAGDPSPSEQPTEQGRGGLLARFSSQDGQSASQPRPDDAQQVTQQGGRGKAASRAPSPSQGKSQGKAASQPQGKGQTRPNSDARNGAVDERSPRAGEWSASDFDSHELEAWDHHDDAPFALPESPDDTYERTIQEARKARERSRSGASYQRYDQDAPASERDRREPRATRGRGESAPADWSASGAYKTYDPYDSHERRSATRRRSGWDDFDDDIEWDDGWDDGWQTGQWDTGWATGMRPAQTGRDLGRDGWEDDEYGGYDPRNEPVGYGARGATGATPRVGQARRDRRAPQAEDNLSQSLDTLAQLSAVGAPLSRLKRVRMLFRRRPTAAAMLAFFLLGFMLTCCAPMIPLVRLGYDASDAYQRVTRLQSILAGGTSSLLNTQTLGDVQTQLDGLSHDLYEINGAVNVAGAPIAALSSSARNYRLLVRMGYDLTTAGDEAVQMAQIVLTPLAGGALAATGSPGLQPSDIQRARSLLADADAYVSDALSAYGAINPATLPKQLQPGTKYGKLLAELPLAPAIFTELKTLLDAAPALLGIGQPAYYLVVVLDNTELRPGGGFQGNYGVLELDGGKQSASNPLQLNDTYNLDETYAQKHTQSATADPACPYTMPEPPNYYWWWPYRCIPPGQQTLGWGLRDSNLSPDFPTNARTAMQIAEDGGAVPNNAPLQGEVAFTPALIAQLMTLTGNITLSDYNTTVTPQNVVVQIHEHQLGSLQTAGQGRKQFTHELASELLTKIKALHGSALKSVFTVGINAIKSKDLQVYLADPRAELILQQLNMASTVSTGNSDGYFVVDTNDGGNKANAYVSEHQTDLVTLLPNGGAYHQLELTITYNKTGSVYTNTSRDYYDLQRTYFPGDATIMGWAGFTPTGLSSDSCQGAGNVFTSFVTDCTPQHGLYGVSTDSDIPGRTMVLGTLTVLCGPYSDVYHIADANTENAACDAMIPGGMAHTAHIFLSWYTPHASTVDANGHGTWSELVEKQAGSNSQLTVYIANGHSVNSGGQVSDDATFQSLLQSAKKIYDQPLAANTTVTYSF